MIKGKFIRMKCTKQIAWNCSHSNVDYVGNTYPECIQKAKDDGWDIKNEICRNCLVFIKKGYKRRIE